MIEIRCGDSVECAGSHGGAVVCSLVVTGREYARLRAIADTLNSFSGETPNYGCEADNTPATVFAGFFANFPDLDDEQCRFAAFAVADAGFELSERDAVAGRLADALKRADEAFAKSA